MGKTKVIGIVLMLVLFVYFFIPLRGNLTGYAIVNGAPMLSFEILSVQSFYGSSPSCHSNLEGTLYNEGFSYAEEVSISCKLLDDKSNLLGSSTYHAGMMDKRSSKPFFIRIGTKCISAMAGQKYQCELDCKNCV